jgi:hypothetical protein
MQIAKNSGQFSIVKAMLSPAVLPKKVRILVRAFRELAKSSALATFYNDDCGFFRIGNCCVPESHDQIRFLTPI